MTKPQFQRVYEKMKLSGERLMHLDWFSAKLNDARIVELDSDEWVRLDRFVHSEEEIFRSVAFSMDYQFGRDAAGNIYVSKDHALNILEWNYDGTKKKLGVARIWVFVLFVVLILTALNHCTG